MSVYGPQDVARPSGRGSGDFRDAFAHDRDRILYANAFRRLADKTQVVAVSESGSYHTRLTHSLKVAQLGRRFAERLQGQALNRHDIDPQHHPLLPPNPDLIEAACLAHDLGHPPFGHVGEVALNAAMDARVVKSLRKQYANTDAHNPTAEEERDERLQRGGFEGNAQSFRILAYLETHRHADRGGGLDLTRATLDAATKYPWRRESTGKASQKWGFYEVDRERMGWVRDCDPATLTYPQRQSFEAQLMDWCDDVTYAVHDVEDFYRYGFIPLERLFPVPGLDQQGVEIEEQRRFFEYIEEKKRKSQERFGWFDRERARDIWYNVLPHLITISQPFEPSNKVNASIDHTRSQIITFFANAVDYSGGLPLRYDAALDIDDNARYTCDLLNQLIWFYVIDRPALKTQQEGKRHVVETLLNTYCRNVDLLPDDRKQELNEHGDEIRACVDHVSCLTERQAVALFHRFTGTDLGELGAPIWLV